MPLTLFQRFPRPAHLLAAASTGLLFAAPAGIPPVVQRLSGPPAAAGSLVAGPLHGRPLPAVAAAQRRTVREPVPAAGVRRREVRTAGGPARTVLVAAQGGSRAVGRPHTAPARTRPTAFTAAGPAEVGAARATEAGTARVAGVGSVRAEPAPKPVTPSAATAMGPGLATSALKAGTLVIRSTPAGKRSLTLVELSELTVPIPPR